MTMDGLTGRLLLSPGRSDSIVCERPMVGAALLGRLTQGRHAALLPDVLASVFTLCADAQRSTSRRALQAALGLAEDPDDAARDARLIALHAAQEQLHRLALDLPSLSTGAAVQAGWLRGAPVMALPSFGSAARAQALQSAAAALPAWLDKHLLGMPVAEWLTAWQRDRGAWLAHWCAQQDHPVAHWLSAVRPDAQAAGWDCRALDLSTTDALRAIAAAVEADASFAERPVWQGGPAETGPWTRAARVDPVHTVWDRLGARIADLARLALGQPLSCGALTLADGVGLAWTEMSRGLLMHWVQLEPGERRADNARVARYHVLAPTEWNFHPDGAFARWLAGGAGTTAQVRLAAAALDPCIEFKLGEAASHA
jgi:hypothetical protein